MGILSGIGGLVGGAMGLFGGGSGNQVPQGPAPWLMPNMAGAANNAFSGIQGLTPFTNIATGALPQAQSTFSNLYNNPNAGGFLQGANIAGNMGTMAAGNAFNTGGAIANTGMGTFPIAGQIF